MLGMPKLTLFNRMNYAVRYYKEAVMTDPVGLNVGRVGGRSNTGEQFFLCMPGLLPFGRNVKLRAIEKGCRWPPWALSSCRRRWKTAPFLANWLFSNYCYKGIIRILRREIRLVPDGGGNAAVPVELLQYLDGDFVGRDLREAVP